MSWLSSATGVHISKHGVHIEPLKALGTALTVGSLGGLGPVAGALSRIPGAATAAGALSKIPGAGKVGGYLASHLGGGAPTAPGGNGVGDPNAPINIDPNTGLEDMNAGGGGGIGGYLKSALDGINPLQAGLGVAGVVNAGQLGAKANKYAGQAMDSAAGSYAERAGLRKAGVQGMLNPQVPDTSNLSRIRSANPYSAAA